MTPDITAVLEARRPWTVAKADVLTFLAALPADSCSLCFFSPPYERARTYLEAGVDLGIARDTEEWVAWLVEVFSACRRVCTGLVACVCEGQTKDYRYSAGPLLLAADLCRAGFVLRKPPIYRRCGIPGSGGPDWLRNDYEYIVCTTRGGKLPWADGTACGHPPKWAPGGEMSHRLTDGARVNQWGYMVDGEGQPLFKQPQQNGAKKRCSRLPSHEITVIGAASDQAEPGLFGPIEAEAAATRNPLCPKGGYTRSADGKPKPGHGAPKGGYRLRTGPADGEEQQYVLPVLANPGNVVQRTYTAREVAAMLGEPSDVVDCVVGGGQMGSALASENEAPFPESLAAFFVRSFCPPGGLVLDPFAGSGTTLVAAVAHGRRGLGCDLRQSQVDLTRRRLDGVTPTLFPEGT